MSAKPIDFLQPIRPPQVGWWLLAAGVAAIGLGYWCDLRWASERQRAEQAQQAAMDAVRAAQKPIAIPVPSASEKRLQRARAELRRPWLASLRAIESAAVDPVYLLGLSFEPATGTIKIEAEAPNFEHALAFTQVLADGVTLPSATLASHEQVADATSVRPTVRFTVLTRWSAP